VFGILLNLHIDGVSPDAFVSLGSVNLNNDTGLPNDPGYCGSRIGSVTVTAADLTALEAP
jgi:hypothetical protein